MNGRNVSHASAVGLTKPTFDTKSRDLDGEIAHRNQRVARIDVQFQDGGILDAQLGTVAPKQVSTNLNSNYLTDDCEERTDH